MNTSGWLQIVFYVVVLLLLAKPLGAFMAAVYEGRAVRSQRVGGWLERLDLSRRGRGPGARNELDRLRPCDALVQPARRIGCLRAATVPGTAPAQSAGPGRGEPGLVVQYGDKLHHQYQLAGLRRRKHDELSDADARARRPEFRIGSVGHGGAGRADPRLRAQAGRRHRQFLVRPRAVDGLHPAAALDRVCAGPGEPGRRADVRQVRHRHARPAGDLRRARRTARTVSR